MADPLPVENRRLEDHVVAALHRLDRSGGALLVLHPRVARHRQVGDYTTVVTQMGDVALLVLAAAALEELDLGIFVRSLGLADQSGGRRALELGEVSALEKSDQIGR